MSYYNCSDVTPDLLDSLQNLWGRFAAGFIYADNYDDELIVDCPYCNEDHSYSSHQQAICEQCRPWRHRSPPHGFSLLQAA